MGDENPEEVECKSQLMGRIGHIYIFIFRVFENKVNHALCLQMLEYFHVVFS